MKKMTMRERMLAVIQGREHDRVPFAIYEILLPYEKVRALLGRGNIGRIRFCSIFRAETPNFRRESRIFFEGGAKWERNVIHTPKGEAVAMWPEKRLWLNFPSSVHLAPPEQIRATADQILADAGHTGRLQIQISENLPLDRWQTSLPIIAQVIEAFGEP